MQGLVSIIFYSYVIFDPKSFHSALYYSTMILGDRIVIIIMTEIENFYEASSSMIFAIFIEAVILVWVLRAFKKLYNTLFVINMARIITERMKEGKDSCFYNNRWVTNMIAGITRLKMEFRPEWMLDPETECEFNYWYYVDGSVLHLLLYLKES